MHFEVLLLTNKGWHARRNNSNRIKKNQYFEKSNAIVFFLSDATLQFLTTALQRHELSSAGATSLQYLCEACSTQMVQHHSSLVQLMQVRGLRY